MTFSGDDTYRHSIVDVATGLHSSFTGASDPTRDEGMALAWLSWRCEEGWHPTSKHWTRFENAVREMARAAVAERRP